LPTAAASSSATSSAAAAAPLDLPAVSDAQLCRLHPLSLPLIDASLLPTFLQPAASLLSSQPNWRARLLTAIACALHVHCGPLDAKEVTAARLLPLNSHCGTGLGFGNGVLDGVVNRWARTFCLVAAQSSVAYSAKQPIDAAMRCLLRTLASGVSALALVKLQQIRDFCAGPSVAVAASSSLCSPSSSAAAAPVRALPRCAEVVVVSGANNQCLSRCITLVTGMDNNKFKEALQQTLDAFTPQDAGPLLLWGFPELASPVTAASLNTARTHYYESRRFEHLDFCGDLELHLLARHSGGRYSFALVAPALHVLLRPTGRIHHSPLLPDAQQVYLHYCHPKGSPLLAPKHFNLITFVTPDGHTHNSWPAAQSPEEAATLETLATLAAQQSDERVCAAATQKDRENDAALHKLLEQEKSNQGAPAAAASSPITPTAPDKRRKKASDTPRHSRSSSSHFPAAPLPTTPFRLQPTATPFHPSSVPAAAAVSSSSTPSFVPSPARCRTWHELPHSAKVPFLALALPLFEAYGHYSSSGAYDSCSEVLQLILDMPARSMPTAGRSRPRTLVRSLEAQMEPMTAALESIRQAAAADDAEAAASDSAAAASATRLLATARTLLPAASAALFEELAAPAAPDDTQPVDDETRAARRAVAKIRGGGRRCISRSANCLLQQPMASASDPATLAELHKLHPQQRHTLPPPPPNTALGLVAVEWPTLAKLIKNRIDNGASPGPSGWSGSHIQLIAGSDNAKAKDGLALLVKDLCNGIFAGATRERLLASLLEPVSKGEGRGIRPIAMGESFVKLAAHYSMSLIEADMPALFPRIQFGVKRPGGSETAAQLTRAYLAQSSLLHPDTIALKTDFANAFNSANRQQAWTALQKDARTEPIWRMFHWAYSSASPLLVYDGDRLCAQLQSSEGVRQGDPFAAFVFAFFVQPMYEAAIAGLPNAHAISIQDDLTLIGPQQDVFAAFNKVRELAPQYGLTLRMDKCAVFIPESVSSDNRSTIRGSCNALSLAHSDRMESLGVMFGSSAAIDDHCTKSLKRHEQFLAALRNREMPVQIALLLLRFCAVPRLSYLARTVDPNVFAAPGGAAELFDSMLWNCFAQLIGSRDASSLPKEVRLQAQLPLSRGGLGLRSVKDLAPTAYFSSLASSLSDFIAEFQPADRGDESWIAQSQMARELECFWIYMQMQGIQQLAPPAKVKKTASPHSRPAAAATAAAAPSTGTNSAPLALARSHPSLSLFASSSSIPFAAPASSSSSCPLSGPGAATLLCREAAAHARLLVASRRSPATHPTPAVFRHAEQLQAIATKQREDVNRAALIAQSVARRQALLTATSVSNSAAFLSTLPTVAAYTLGDESMIQAVRHRLGLSAADALVPQVCVCGTFFAVDPDHYHSCVKLRSSSLTLRHNAIVNTLASLATEAGWHVTVEPNDHLRPAPTDVATVAPTDATAAAKLADGVSCSDEPESEHWNRHGDLLLLRHGIKLYIDVSCTRPTNASSLSSQPAVTHTPLVSTVVRAQQKMRKYTPIAQANGYTLLPFVVETYGGMGKEALRVLQYLAAHASDSPQQFLRHAHSSLSVVLQRGNALVALIGQQQLNVRRQREHKSVREAIQRCRHYGQLGSIQQQRQWLDPDISAVHAAVTEAHAPSSHSPSHSHSHSSLPLPFVHASHAFSTGANAVAALSSHSHSHSLTLSQLYSAAAAALMSVSG
jgi:hypothetical protein